MAGRGKLGVEASAAASECKPPSSIGWFGDDSPISQNSYGVLQGPDPPAMVLYDDAQNRGTEEVRV